MLMNTDRIYQGDDHDWYFTVRGNQAIGPFPSFHDAETALTQHVKKCSKRVNGKPGWPRALSPVGFKRRGSGEPRHT